MRNLNRFSLLLIILFAGCSADNSDEQTKNTFRFTKEYWGEWITMDTGETWYLNDTQILIKDIPYPNKVSLRKENKNAIEVTEGRRKYYIYASRIKDASFKGRVVQGSGSVIGGSEQGVGSIAVIISNLNNASDQTIVVTDEDGNYVVKDIIPFDSYEVTIEGKTWTVNPGDGDDVGIMALRDGVNLKATLTAIDKDRIFTDNDYAMGIEFKNIGNTAVSEGTYAFYTFESPGIRPDDYQGSNYVLPEVHIPLGGLKPKAKKSISFNIKCDAITDEYVEKRIGVTIVDPEAGITIKDYASIKIKTRVDLFIEAENPIQGILIAPYKKAYHVKSNGYSYKVVSERIPWCRDDFLLILSGQGNTTYSVGIGLQPSRQWANLTDRNIYKPNNTEETATQIGMYEQKMAFLNTGEIAYWRINMSNDRP
jgi:hypothetical protein